MRGCDQEGKSPDLLNGRFKLTYRVNLKVFSQLAYWVNLTKRLGLIDYKWCDSNKCYTPHSSLNQKFSVICNFCTNRKVRIQNITSMSHFPFPENRRFNFDTRLRHVKKTCTFMTSFTCLSVSDLKIIIIVITLSQMLLGATSWTPIRRW